MALSDMSLRGKILKGGIYFTVRQGLSLIIGLGGVALLTRAIGPGNYGLFASALGIVGYIASLSVLGINFYLVRQEEEPGIYIYNLAINLMFVTGMTGLLLGIIAIPLLHKWFQNHAFIPPLLTMLLTIPLNALAAPASAKLERGLNFRPVAIIELFGQLIFYAIALFLAYLGKGVWAPVTGYLASHVFMTVSLCIIARLIPSPCWSWPIIKDMIRYGTGFSASIWILQLRTLVNPLIVGRYAGPEGVGYVALAIRLADNLSFVKVTAWRLSTVAFAKLQGDFPRLKRALEEAMGLQVCILGPLMAGFASVAPWALHLLLGRNWNAVLSIYPYIALGSVAYALFVMHLSLLYVLKRSWDASKSNLLHILLFAVGALYFVPRFGLLGYGFAEILALLSYIVLHFQVRRIFHPSYLETLPWLISFLPPLFTTVFVLPAGLILWVPLLFILVLPGPRKVLLDYVKLLATR